MTNDKLPEETKDGIINEASDQADKIDVKNDYQNGVKYGYETGYIAGATAWAAWKVKHDEVKADFERVQKSAIHYANRKDEVEKERDQYKDQAQRMADDVSRVRDIIKGLTAAETHRFPTLQYLDNELEKTLQQFKDGGKEVGASQLLNLPEDAEPKGMPLPATDPFKK